MQEARGNCTMWNFMTMSLPSIRVGKSQRMRLVLHVWERRGMYGVLVGKPEGNKPFVIPRHICGSIILKWIIQ